MAAMSDSGAAPPMTSIPPPLSGSKKDDDDDALPPRPPPPSDRVVAGGDHRARTAPRPRPRTTNRLFLTFALLSLAVSAVNFSFHHRFHEENVLEKSRREFRGRFRTSRLEPPADDYVRRRESVVDEAEAGTGAVGTGSDEGGAAGRKPPPTGGGGHKLAGLRCKEKYGGPEDEYAEREMAFWSDIPSDAGYKSPFLDGTERFLTFEPDHGGWNNIRMAMETALVMSHAMGRTLVLPPEQRFYLLGKNDRKQKSDFDFGDFFHLDSIAVEHEGFNVISSEEFLRRYGATGKLMNVNTGAPELWGENNQRNPNAVRSYFRRVGLNPRWNPMDCAAAFPAEGGGAAVDALRRARESVMGGKQGGKRGRPTLEEFEGKPTPSDGTTEERLREMLADRDKLCLYDGRLQRAPVIHFPAEKGSRLLTHFYAFLFFADWRADLWSKRFVRDHLRYIDEIMCAAARVVEAVRKRSKHKDGLYDSMHVRRGDFQYKKTRLEAKELIRISKDNLEEGGLLFIATDERDKSFFQPFRERYDVVFLDDFKDLLTGINTNYYGMLDQLVASKGRVFYGTWWSTLSGYVNRMRGYYIAKHKLAGYEDGTMESYYFYPHERVNQMKQYMPVKKPIYMREFPTSWRDIDRGIEGIHQKLDDQ